MKISKLADISKNFEKKRLPVSKKVVNLHRQTTTKYNQLNLTTMKYQVRITENGKTRTLPATMTKEDAKWEVKMQKWLDEMVGETSRKYTIIEA